MLTTVYIIHFVVPFKFSFGFTVNLKKKRAFAKILIFISRDGFSIANSLLNKNKIDSYLRVDHDIDTITNRGHITNGEFPCKTNIFFIGV